MRKATDVVDWCLLVLVAAALMALVMLAFGAFGCSPPDDPTQPQPQAIGEKQKDYKLPVLVLDPRGGGNEPVLIIPGTTPAPVLPESLRLAHQQWVSGLRGRAEHGE